MLIFFPDNSMFIYDIIINNVKKKLVISARKVKQNH